MINAKPKYTLPLSAVNIYTNLYLVPVNLLIILDQLVEHRFNEKMKKFKKILDKNLSKQF